ncbi:hypothetical protein V1477_001133 [Vespula maculifrons]|uniref:Uncharacterized protein n=1 Tax=Vespula maculifrons TaxID=7453 RepID=A0ABD2CZK3_VESMC
MEASLSGISLKQQLAVVVYSGIRCIVGLVGLLDFNRELRVIKVFTPVFKRLREKKKKKKKKERKKKKVQRGNQEKSWGVSFEGNRVLADNDIRYRTLKGISFLEEKKEEEEEEGEKGEDEKRE